MYALFAGTMFVSAALLFCVQPMIAKMILPLLGGSPAVWNTCMVFFQAALLAGYVYAHASTAWLGVRLQATVHLVLLWMPLLLWPLGVALPIGLGPNADQSLPYEANPIPWLLGVLLVSVGLPFFVVSATAPLMQKWFADTGHPAANDPYFLYSASNLGSMLSLLSYPILLEPTFRLRDQSLLWSIGYGVLAILISSCAWMLRRSHVTDGKKETVFEKDPVAENASPTTAPAPVTTSRRLRWVALSFVPSSLMLGVTTYITTDIAAIPLLWIIPLALYLLSFILVFAGKPILPHAWMVALLPMVVLSGILVFLLAGAHLMWPMIPFHFLVFFLVAMFCHGELARDRPPVTHLTEFYLWMSIGGVLGGLFNSLSAPLLFTQFSVVEYPLVLILSCLLLPRKREAEHSSWSTVLDVGLPLVIGVSMVLIYFVWNPSGPIGVLLLGVLALVCLSFSSRPFRFALGLGMIVLPVVTLDLHAHTLYRDRNFFGSLRVVDDTDAGLRLLMHGSTLHGQQSLDPERSGEPLSYFSRTGPIGQVFDGYNQKPVNPRIAIAGLGVGAMASYAQPDQEWIYYEIDPAMILVARDVRFFTYLKDCKARRLDVIPGDARLRLRDAPGDTNGFGMIVIDAFSSDSIPAHLLTAEALQLYLSKLAPNGILAFNISNRFLDLKPVLGNLAMHVQPTPLVCYARDDLEVSDAESKAGKSPSQWIVMARHAADLGDLVRDPRWHQITGDPNARVWTDDFSNILSVFKWR